MDDADLEWHAWPPRITGGQQVTRMECGVLVIHLPTGLAAVSTNERSQLRNRERAREILTAAVANNKHPPSE